MKNKPLEKIFSDLDRHIRSGQHGKARKILLSLGASKLPRSAIAPIANIARRVNMHRMAAFLLDPIVRPKFQISPPATAEEKALYGSALSRLGVFKEAELILKALQNDESYPDAKLFLAFNSISQWNSSEAIPVLKRYVADKKISYYSQLVGKLNIASCYNSDLREIEAREVIKEIQNSIEQQEDPRAFNLIYANSLEIEAQLEVYVGNYVQSLALISRAEEKLRDTRSRYEFFVKKWKMIVAILQNSEKPQVKADLKSLMSEGVKSRNWEALRDFDFFFALANRSRDGFLKVYFGTPYFSYRQRVIKIFRPEFRIPEFFDWFVHDTQMSEWGKDSKVRRFDLARGCEDGGAAMLAKHPLLLNLLRLLARDFYRPIAMGTLISELYPNEYYNPITSPQKVHRAIKRLRKWFTENHIPLVILLKNNTFRLVATAPYVISIPTSLQDTDRNEAYLEKLRIKAQDRTFNSKEASAYIEISINPTLKFLKWALDNKKIVRQASGRSTKYKLAK